MERLGFRFRKTQLFEDIDREFREAEEMLNRMFRTVRKVNPSDIAVQGPYYYGY